MRKLILAAAVALSLGGCAGLQTAFEVASFASKSHTNPVTKNDLYRIESGIQIAFIGLNTYKRSCVRGLVDVHCRANVAAIQVYTRQLPPLLIQLRGFVKNNDQINAVVIYNQLTTLIATMKSSAVAIGVPLGG